MEYLFLFALDIEAEEDGGTGGFDRSDETEEISFFSSGEAGRLDWQDSAESDLETVFLLA